jgi:hypothetical protein
MVEKEIAVRFMAYNLIRGSMVVAAHKHNKIPRHLSFKAASQLLRAVNIQLCSSVKSFISKSYEQ